MPNLRVFALLLGFVCPCMCLAQQFSPYPPPVLPSTDLSIRKSAYRSLAPKRFTAPLFAGPQEQGRLAKPDPSDPSDTETPQTPTSPQAPRQDCGDASLDRPLDPVFLATRRSGLVSRDAELAHQFRETQPLRPQLDKRRMSPNPLT